MPSKRFDHVLTICTRYSSCICCGGDIMVGYNQRLPGACNRSPGSKLLSITTQLHCGGHLGGRGERNCRTQFWKRIIQWLFHQSLVLIELLVPDKMVFMWISHRVLCKTKYSCAAILVRGRDHQTQFWKRTIQWLFYQSLVPIEQLVPDKNIFMWISHRFLC